MKKSDRSLVRGQALCLACLLCIGCFYRPTTSLRYNPIRVMVSNRSTKTVAVLPLEEARGPRLYPWLEQGLIRANIPFLPYVTISYERLDESHILHQKKLGRSPAQSEHFTVALAQQIARDLQYSNLFLEVKFVSNGEAASAHDLLLRGTLRSTEFDISVSSYMLGLPGLLLWVLPIPMGKDAATVAIDLSLEDDSGETLWSYSLSERADKMFTIYNFAGGSTSDRHRIEIKQYGSNEFGVDGNSYWAYHAEALRRGMKGAKASIVKTLLAQR